VRWVLGSQLGDRAPYITYFLGVIVASYAGGLGPGLVATFLSAAVIAFFWLQPFQGLAISTSQDWAGIYRFLLVGVTISVFSGALHAARRRAEDNSRRVIEQEKRYRTIVEAASEGIWIIDGDARTTFVNPRLCEMFGYTAGEMLGRTPFDFIFDEDQQAARERMRQRQAGDILPREFRYRRKDGSELWAMISTSALHGPKGELAGLLGLLTDITRNRRAEQMLRRSEARLKRALQAARMVAWDWDPQTKQITLTENFPEVLGRLPHEGWDQGFGILRPEDMQRHRQLVEDAVAKGGGYRSEYRVTRADDGATVWLEEVGEATLDETGRVQRVTGVVMDVSERKGFEAERDALLVREQEARRLAEDANRMKDDFLATLSHELRAPLNAIVGWSEMLIRKQLSEAATEQAVSVIHRNAKAQAKIIEDLLDASRIISGKLILNRQPVDLETVIDAALDAVRPMADAMQITVGKGGAPPGAPVIGDPARLQQVAINLLTNAVKFTPRGGQVSVRLDSDEQAARIIVQDTGEGISADFLPHIFERFRQADSSYTRKHSGLGLGLAIVSHLVELHGGTVEASSAGVGQGATFTVTLPLAQAALEPVPPEASGAGLLVDERKLALKGVRVLVVDDDEDTREVFRTMLTLQGAETVTAESAAEAISRLREWRPDVLLSDIGMPGEDGYALIRQVRSLRPDEGGKTPAVALTGYASEEESSRAWQAGFQAHEAKPVDAEKLIATVARLTGVGGKGRGA
jgi:PAS domain S-box-containing protein